MDTQLCTPCSSSDDGPATLDWGLEEPDLNTLKTMFGSTEGPIRCWCGAKTEFRSPHGMLQHMKKSKKHKQKMDDKVNEAKANARKQGGPEAALSEADNDRLRAARDDVEAENKRLRERLDEARERLDEARAQLAEEEERRKSAVMQASLEQMKRVETEAKLQALGEQFRIAVAEKNGMYKMAMAFGMRGLPGDNQFLTQTTNEHFNPFDDVTGRIGLE